MLHEDERIGGCTEVKVWQASMLVCWNRCIWYFFIECTVLVWGCQGKLCWNSFAITGNSKCKLKIDFGA
jgi:hypothetical protein